MASKTERTKILEMVESGAITAEDALTLLSALGDPPLTETNAESVDDFMGAPTSLPEPEETIAEFGIEETFDEEAEAFDGEAEVMVPVSSPPDPEDIRKWKRWWVVPLWIGAGITTIGGLLMFWAFSANGFGFWFACAWSPFLLGVAVLALAWGSRTVPWLHVRIYQKPGETPERIALSFPIPIRLTAWGIKTFGHYIPNMDATGLDEVILALKDTATAEMPFFVDVDEGEDGERVQVFIG